MLEETKIALQTEPPEDPTSGSVMLAALAVLLPKWRRLVLIPIGLGAIALALTYTVAPVYTAKTVIVPPQSQQSLGAAAALASVSALGGLAAGAGLRSPADQYAAFLQSATLRDRLIDEFGLMEVYESKLRVDARVNFAQRVRIAVGRKEGLLTIEVDDTVPQRAAAIANAHVKQLIRLSSGLQLTEAQERRAFFERQVDLARTRLAAAQADLQATGFSEAALRSEPRAAADAFARLKAEVTGTEVRLQTLRRSMTDSAPEVVNLMTTLGALREQLSRLGSTPSDTKGPDYLGKYREFKYQESLYELFVRQFEYARLDESREGTVVQVVDVASVPERKSSPRRGSIAINTTLTAAAAMLLLTWLGYVWPRLRDDPLNASSLESLRSQFRRTRAN